MKKKALAIVLLAIISVGTFISCGGNEKTSNDIKTEEGSQEAQDKKTKGNKPKRDPQELYDTTVKTLKNLNIDVENAEPGDYYYNTIQVGNDIELNRLIDKENNWEVLIDATILDAPSSDEFTKKSGDGDLLVTFHLEYGSEFEELKEAPKVDFNNSIPHKVIKGITGESVDFTKVNTVVQKNINEIFPSNKFDFEEIKIEYDDFTIVVYDLYSSGTIKVVLGTHY